MGIIVGVPSSPRCIPLRHARRLREMVPGSAACVLVTVPDALEGLVEACGLVEPDAVQVHGGRWPSEKVVEALPGLQLIRSMCLKPGETPEDALKLAEGYDTVHLDSYARGKYGGTGKNQSLETARQVRSTVYPRRMILAGGLTHDNVKEAVHMVKPYAVDVCSGVEASPGVKDPVKVEQFVRYSRTPILDDIVPPANWRKGLRSLEEVKGVG